MGRQHVYRILLQFVVVFLLSQQVICQPQTGGTPPPKCHPGLIVDCNHNHEDPVWSTDDQVTCKIILNRCVFNNLNCYRYRNNKTLLSELSKETCQKMCKNQCADESKPRVCASRGDSNCYFSNDCALENYVCNTGEIWIPQINRLCDNKLSAVCPNV